MRDKIRIELSSENRLAWEPFYAVLDLPPQPSRSETPSKERESPAERI